MRHHRSRVVGATSIIAGLVLVIATVGSAAAARGELFTIAIGLDASANGEIFTSDSALLCPSGVAMTDFHRASGNFWAAGSFHLDKLIVCDDGSGTFVIRVDAASNFITGAGTQGGWSVVPGSGTGDYAGLTGGGNVVGINVDSPSVDLVDHYYGSLRV